MLRGFDQLDHFRFCELLLLSDDVGRDALTINCERNKDRLPSIPRDPFTAEGNIFNCEFDRSHWRTFAWTARFVEPEAVDSLFVKSGQDRMLAETENPRRRFHVLEANSRAVQKPITLRTTAGSGS